MSDTTTAPAGWYADPAGHPGQRWWDGSRWTAHVQPAPFPMSLSVDQSRSSGRSWGLPSAAADRAAGRNSPAFHALILGLVGLVANAVLLPAVGALALGAVGWARAAGWARAGHPATGRVMAVTSVGLGLIGLLAFVL